MVWRNATIRALFLATATLTFCMSFMASLYTLFALSDLGLSPAELGVTIGCGGIGGLAGAALAQPAAVRWGARRTLIGALVAGGVVQVLIPLAPAVPAIAMTFLIVTQVIGDGALTVYLDQRNDAAATVVARRRSGPGRGHLAGRHRAR